MWWLDPSWRKAECARCGDNIWNSGGDPDWSLCFRCFSKRHRESLQRTEDERRKRERDDGPQG